MTVKAGDVFEWERTFTKDDVEAFGRISGDVGRHHREPDESGRLVVHGLLTATLPTKLGGDVSYLARDVRVPAARLHRRHDPVLDARPRGRARGAPFSREDDGRVPKPAGPGGAPLPERRRHPRWGEVRQTCDRVHGTRSRGWSGPRRTAPVRHTHLDGCAETRHRDLTSGASLPDFSGGTARSARCNWRSPMPQTSNSPPSAPGNDRGDPGGDAPTMSAMLAHWAERVRPLVLGLHLVVRTRRCNRMHRHHRRHERQLGRWGLVRRRLPSRWGRSRRRYRRRSMRFDHTGS